VHAARIVRFPPANPAVECRLRSAQLESAFDIGPSVRISGKTSALSRTGNREAVVSRWIIDLAVTKGAAASVINGDPSRRHRSRGARVVGSHGVNQAPPLGVPALGTF